MVVLFSGPNLEPNLLTDNKENFENAAVETLILICSDTTVIGKLNYTAYMKKSEDLKRLNPIHGVIYYI
jgi:hypothetical protein